MFRLLSTKLASCFYDPVASTTPSGLPAWGPRTARGSDTDCGETQLGPVGSRVASLSSEDFNRNDVSSS